MSSQAYLIYSFKKTIIYVPEGRVDTWNFFDYFESSNMSSKEFWHSKNNQDCSSCTIIYLGRNYLGIYSTGGVITNYQCLLNWFF
jgi:hypothetical protein